MWLSDISIRRPVLATVMSLILILLGVISLLRLPVREYPDIDPPIVSVNTVFQGASPETIETTVTEILEDQLMGIEGIRTMTSTSREQVSNIVIEFKLDRNVDIAAQDVRDRVSRVRGKLPDDIEEPVISKQDTDASAIMWLALHGDKFTRLQLSDYADKYLVDPLQTVSGVGSIIIGGERKYSMRLWLDPMKMAAHGIAVSDIEQALQKENIEIPSGRIESKKVEFTVRTLGELTRPEEFNNLVIKMVDGSPVYLRDVGRAEIGPQDDRSFVRYNGKAAVGLGVVKQSKANTLDVAKDVKKEVARLQKQLPPGMTLEPSYDSSLFIERSIHEVIESIFITAALVILVIYLFLGNIRSASIPAMAIPISLIATFAVMLALNFTINTFTLLALTLTIGLVVDDAIVVLENIHRHIEMGKTPMQAAFEGSKEISFAILATTVVLVAVFIPIGFMTGATGKLFSEFAISVAASVVISGFVSLSLSPMMCSRLLKPHQEKTHQAESKKGIFGFFHRIPDLYQQSLAWSLNHPIWIVSISLIFAVLSGGLYKVLPSELLPIEDRGNIVAIINAPEGATKDYTDQAVRQAEAIFDSIPEVNRYFAVVAMSAEGPGRVNEALMFARMIPWEDRKVKQQDVVQQILPQMMRIPEAFVFPINPPSGPARNFRGSIQYVLKGFDVQELQQYSDLMLKEMKSIPGLVNVDTNLKLNKPQLEIKINREKAALLGVSVRDISRAMQVLMGGADVTRFKIGNKSYDVMVQAIPESRSMPAHIQQIMVHSRDGQLIPLSSVVDIKETVSPKELNHYNRLRSVTISASNIPQVISLGDALEQMDQIAKRNLPPSITTEYAGDSKEFKDAGQTFLLMFTLALLFVYLVLAAQFESFKHPFVVMLTVPLAVGGAILTLFYVNGSINVYSQIGMVLLIGLVTKNGILIVEYANQLCRTQGMTTVEAIYEAAQIRFRPIVMTTIAMIMGALPIALAIGAGSESRQTMGIAIVGGLFFSTLLTLFLIPVVYKLLNPDKSTSSESI